MRTERLVGWCGLFLIGLIGAAYRARDWVVGDRDRRPRDASLSRHFE
jgi:hypothetical protein